MNIKQIVLTLIALFIIDTVALSQVKKQYRDEVHTSTTVVVKEAGASDLDILNSHFNLDDFAVNEQIKITTDQTTVVASNAPENVSGGKIMSPPAPDLSNASMTTASSYERTKTKMKRWSVREKKAPKNTEEVIVKTEETAKQDIATPTTTPQKLSRKNSIRSTKKSSSGKYRKKSKKVRKKKRVRKLKNRKRKTRRNKKGACYKF